MKRPHVEMGRTFVGVVDPHRHVDDVQLAQPAGLDPFLRPQRGGREAVVEVDPVAQAPLPRQRDHLPGLRDLVGYGLLAQHGDAAAQQFHRRRVVIPAVLHAGRADAGHVHLQAAVQQVGDTVERLAAVGLRRLVGLVLDGVADGHDRACFMRLVVPGVVVADAAHAHHRDIQPHLQLLLCANRASLLCVLNCYISDTCVIRSTRRRCMANGYHLLWTARVTGCAPAGSRPGWGRRCASCRKPAART